MNNLSLGGEPPKSMALSPSVTYCYMPSTVYIQTDLVALIQTKGMLFKKVQTTGGDASKNSAWGNAAFGVFDIFYAHARRKKTFESEMCAGYSTRSSIITAQLRNNQHWNRGILDK